MNEALSAMAIMGALALACGLLLGWAATTLHSDDEQLISKIDALLPQTQCAQCGYPGCRPYAQAIAAGAKTNLCPPGGQQTADALAALLGQTSLRLAEETAPEAVAVIDETACIGCTWCVPVCPVDAIIGGKGYMHTIVSKWCTGCALCLDPCPTSCISLQPLQPDAPAAGAAQIPAPPSP